MDQLARIRLFVRVAERGSFSGVARELGLSQSAVSRAVQDLERTLGISLLSRTTRSLTLTPQGERFLSGARTAIEVLEQAMEDAVASQSAPFGRLRVTAAVGFGQHRVAPVLMDWVAAWEGSRADLFLTDRVVDLVAEGFDVAIRVGELDPSTLRAVRIGTEPRHAVASPDFVARFPLRHPDELAQVPVIGFASLSRPWTGTWQRGEERVHVVVDGPFSANHLPTVRDALLRGLGASVVPDWLVSADLSAGRLVRVLGEWSPGASPIHAVLPPGRHVPRRARSFVDQLKERLA